ncbi:hypothetical protein J5N97_026394 [Dioscorea zingiberensis]|uniref:Uncharacterized protein n=1 Tax=Dioscorea zingiberensis TaxID=325984 RepID=A0A9D5C213_9LILI|nr:hypothetical protein J5N97_026394 [Dioscorea zingiberensis]
MSTTTKDTHIVVVDVPAASDEEVLTTTSLGKAIEHHPLTEISGSPGHLLLLKLWQREEDLISLRATAIESRLDASKRDAFLLSSLFLAFHAISLTILFSSAHKSHENNICRNWMVPSFLSLITSLVIVSSVQAIICAYWRGWKELQRERVDARALTRCLQELRMKGASFDLSREPQGVRRAKSSSVEVKWHGPLRWFSRNLVTVFLLCASGLIATASKFIICS